MRKWLIHYQPKEGRDLGGGKCEDGDPDNEDIQRSRESNPSKRFTKGQGKPARLPRPRGSEIMARVTHQEPSTWTQWVQDPDRD